MTIDDVKYLCARFCEGMHQDFDLSFSSPNDMIKFCLGFLDKDELSRFQAAMILIGKLSAEDQLRIWNDACRDVRFNNSESATKFTSLVIENLGLR